MSTGYEDIDRLTSNQNKMLNELRYNEFSTNSKSRKRVGRGPGSGNGKTSGKGEKGQNARSGGGVRPGFEGGQMPLFRRIPKRGFHNRNAKVYAEVTLAMLNNLEDGAEVTVETLLAVGAITNPRDGVKILGNGELTKKLTVKVNAFSETAKAKIEAVGGTVEVI